MAVINPEDGKPVPRGRLLGLNVFSWIHRIAMRRIRVIGIGKRGGRFNLKERRIGRRLIPFDSQQKPASFIRVFALNVKFDPRSNLRGDFDAFQRCAHSLDDVFLDRLNHHSEPFHPRAGGVHLAHLPFDLERY